MPLNHSLKGWLVHNVTPVLQQGQPEFDAQEQNRADAGCNWALGELMSLE